MHLKGAEGMSSNIPIRKQYYFNQKKCHFSTEELLVQVKKTGELQEGSVGLGRRLGLKGSTSKAGICPACSSQQTAVCVSRNPWAWLPGSPGGVRPSFPAQGWRLWVSWWGGSARARCGHTLQGGRPSWCARGRMCREQLCRMTWKQQTFLCLEGLEQILTFSTEKWTSHFEICFVF